MVSQVVPPKDQVPRLCTMQTNEIATAVNIKSRINRASVIDAISSVQQRQKIINRIPPNGLALYCGFVVGLDGKERKISIDITPHKPINTSQYRCDNRFHIEPQQNQQEDDARFGFIVVDGSSCQLGAISGSARTIQQKFTVDLPKKHGRGGQSAQRFSRIRDEKRHNYIRKVGETCTSVFITGDKPNVNGQILAGSADLKSQLAESDLFDQRLRAILIATVDVAYGGENGFNQAIELASDSLSSVKQVHEKKQLSQYFNEIARDTGKVAYGIHDVLAALEMSAVESIIVWESLPHHRYELRNPLTCEVTVEIYDDSQAKDSDNFCAPDGTEQEVVSKEQLVDWLSNNYKSFGASLHLVTNKSQEGTQFVRGFGGLGGMLRYKQNTTTYEEEFLEDDDFI